MSPNIESRKGELANLDEAASIMAEIEKAAHIAPEQLEKKWQAAASLIARAGIEIEATDTKSRPFKDPQKEAHKIHEEIAALQTSIQRHDAGAEAKSSRELQKGMEAGIRATILEHHGGSGRQP